jgi:peptidyl-prolyl cis-trans isomerase B (cyclophilin B)
MKLNEADVEFTLDGASAPQATANFISLVQSDFYESLSCHRLTTSGIFVLQCGDPNGDGSGGPEYRFGPIENAPADDVYPAGTIAMARQGNLGDSMGSQFFIVYEDSTIPSDVAGGYTVFGRVTSGLDAILEIAAAGTQEGTEKPISEVKMTSLSVE